MNFSGIIRKLIPAKKSLKRSIKTTGKYKAIVIGLSSGGMEALKLLCVTLPAEFRLPIIIVQHLSPWSDGEWIHLLNKTCKLTVKEAEEKETIHPGHIYLSPPNYHLLIERDGTFSLSTEGRVSYARPSIDVLFQSAALAYRAGLIGVILTGANHDGTAGLKMVKSCGGLTLVQDPEDAFSSFMPASAIAGVDPHTVSDLKGLIELLIKIDKTQNYDQVDHQK